MYTRNPQNTMARFIIAGMQRDLSQARFQPNFAYENMNLRITPIKDSTMASLHNERGTMYSVVKGIGDEEYETRLRKWYNKICPHDVYKDYFYNENGKVDDSDVEEQDEKPEATENDILGIPIGKSLLGDELTIFTTEYDDEYDIDVVERDVDDFEVGKNKIIDDFYIPNNTDRIYKFWLNGDKLTGKLLYKGHLNFDYRNPIETIGFYENEDIRKVYWLDKQNQPRFINIAADDEELASWNNTSFDFVSSLELKEDVTITKNLSGGLFPAGCVQYMFTYYNMFGQETNIFYQSPLYYTSYKDRGCSPEETNANSFTINIKNLDINFDYVRIYSLVRTSIDSIPTVKRVTDIPIPLSTEDGTYQITYTDTNTNGSTVDPTELLYVGGEIISAYTFAQKDNTLFLGNVNLKRMYVSDSIRDNMRAFAMNTSQDSDVYKEGYISENSSSRLKFYSENGSLSKSSYIGDTEIMYDGYDSYNIGKVASVSLPKNSYAKYFKKGEIYRFGVQFQHYTGKWSDVVWLGDYMNDTIGITTAYVVGDKMETKYTAARAKLDLASDITDINSLISLGYRRVRPVVVYPDINNRLTIAQGVLNNTLYYIQNRYNGIRDNQADYFFRPYVKKSVVRKSAAYREFRHNHEVKSAYYSSSLVGTMNEQLSSAEFDTRATKQCLDYKVNISSSNVQEYYLPIIDRNIVTLNSPELEFDDTIRYLDLSNIKLRILGYVSISYNYSDMDIETTSTPNAWWNRKKTKIGDDEIISRSEYIPQGYRKRIKTRNYYGKPFMSSFSYVDTIEDLPTYTNSDGVELVNPWAWEQVKDIFTAFLICPWQQTGSLNNSKTSKTADVSSKLKYKKISNLFTSQTIYFWKGQTTSTVGRSDGFEWIKSPANIKLWTSDQDTIIKIDDKIYKGNIDDLIIGSKYYSKYVSKVDRDIWADSNGREDELFNSDSIFAIDQYTDESEIEDGIDEDTENVLSLSYRHNNPISVKYKSNVHAVIDLGNEILPMDTMYDDDTDDTYFKIKNDVDSSATIYNVFNAATKTDIDLGNQFLWLGELYREPNDIVNRFGGNTDEALQNNKFTVCGEPVDIYRYEYDENNEIIRDQDGSPSLRAAKEIMVKWLEGDMYFQNYQCLKTYPFTLADENSVSEVLNFDVETRINLAGRYDKNQYDWSALVSMPTNFNLVNNVYSQKNNFMTYSQQDLVRTTINDFPNTVTWTKTKTAGEDIDQWTNITMASTLDMDGDKGQINKLLKMNDEIISFQNTGIAQILYNEQMQMSTTDGLPIEISNSGKVSGKRYISEHTGCTNKWSIVQSPKGCYFVDDINKAMFSFGSEGMNNLSDNLGFHSWVNKESTTTKPWNPVDFNNIVSYYDNKNEDVYFINSKDCLSYSERLGQFESFYSYEHTPYFSRLGDRALWLSSFTDKGYTHDFKFWFMHEGEYNMFFEQYRPFYTTVVVNPDDGSDKVFNNIEFRSDTWDNNNNELLEDTFDTIYAWNEYQRGQDTLTYQQGVVGPLKKKFRIWYANIPRDNKNRLDRIRNPWIFLKLAMNQVNTNRTILHDFNVYYYG